MELNLVSSNIRFASPGDGIHIWANRRQLLANIFTESNAAIIATQEGRSDQLFELRDLLPSYELVDKHRPWIEERMYPCLFVKKDLFHILDSGDIWLSETPHIIASKSFNSSFPRLMTWNKLQVKNSATKLLIVNTHLDHILAETRESQIKVLCEETRKLIDDEYFLVIMGDFNADPESTVRSEMIKNFPELIDSWKIKNLEEEISFHAFQGNVDYAQRIDWIMTDSRLEVINSYHDKRSFNNIYPSDHFPVITKVKV